MIAAPKPTPIYRFIHVDNLEICLKRGGLHAPNHSPQDGKLYKTIHDLEIQNVRTQRKIKCGPQGVIHDYVPFYFGVLSPMLLKLKTGQVQGYQDGQESLIYLMTTIDAIVESQLPFVFSDGHGIASYTSWYDSVENLDKVDWVIVNERYWTESIDDPDRKRRKQAEFLVHKFCPWNVIQKIGVYSDSALIKVQNILQTYSITTSVSVEKAWFY